MLVTNKTYVLWKISEVTETEIEPFFFENEQEEAFTVKGDRYRDMLNEFLFPKIEGEDIGNIWFQ